MVRTDFYYDSCGAGKIHGCRWSPDGDVEAVVQIVHGIAEYIERYDDFAEFLNRHGILVVAEDHMGHGKSIEHGGTKGYFDGGWNAAVDDTVHLLESTRAEFRDVPYFLFGHSMGSFMSRTILCRYPDLDLSGCILCGSGWMPNGVVAAGQLAADSVCAAIGERSPSEHLQSMMFAGYNKRVEHKRTEFDWLTRETAIVDAYIAHPMCGFTATCGLLRDLIGGIKYNQKKKNLEGMNYKLPILFVSGGDDPVGSYGKGVKLAADHFRAAGMMDVSCKLFPLCRHEILNELNRNEIYDFMYKWMRKRADF